MKHDLFVRQTAEKGHVHRKIKGFLQSGQNVGKRDSAVRAAVGLFQKADCDRLGDPIARS